MRSEGAMSTAPVLLLQVYPYPVPDGVSVIVGLPYLLLRNTTVLVWGVIKAIRSSKRSDGGLNMDVWNEMSMVVLRRCAPGEPPTGDKCQGKLESPWGKWKI